MSHEPSDGSRASVSRGSVMDVQPRSRVVASEENIAESSDVNPQTIFEENQTNYSETVEKGIQESINSPDNTEQAVPNSPISTQEVDSSDLEEKAGSFRPELLAEAVAEVSEQEQEKQKILEAKSKNKRQRPVLAIIIAVVTAFSLIGLTAYAYLRSKEKSQSTDITQQQNVQKGQDDTSNTTTSSEVEQVESDIDAVVNSTDDAQEIPDTGINEQAIGF